MLGIQHVVVGLDEGQLADSAVVTALHLSRLLHAKLEVVHAVRTGEERPWSTDEANVAKLDAWIRKEAREDRLAHLWKLLQPFAATHPEVEEMLHIEVGRPASVLASVAEERADPIVVLGGHRHRGLLDFGNTARQVFHHLPCPMWVQQRPWRHLQSILVPVDLSPGSVTVLNLATLLAAACGARLTVLHAFEPLTYTYGSDYRLEEIIDEQRQRARQGLAGFVHEHGGSQTAITTKFEDGDPATEILADQHEHDLIVMGTHGHSAVGRLVLGSQSYRVLRESATPVLIVPQSPTV